MRINTKAEIDYVTCCVALLIIFILNKNIIQNILLYKHKEIKINWIQYNPGFIDNLIILSGGF